VQVLGLRPRKNPKAYIPELHNEPTKETNRPIYQNYDWGSGNIRKARKMSRHLREKLIFVILLTSHNKPAITF
jgi:hypothetical protein